MSIVDQINKKRSGARLSRGELADAVQGYVSGTIPDYQMSAWLMAVACVGMGIDETVDLTEAYVDSGVRLNVPAGSVDKHSTGGVGDKTTLVVGPLVAALGYPFCKMSGRGLEHAGGTVDKLSAIPGMRVNLSQREIYEQVESVGISVFEQTETICPADGKTYSLRDVTGTVSSHALITASVMSKKVATGCSSLVLDVKYGPAALTGSHQEATRLARAMVDVGRRLSLPTVALLSPMTDPIGLAIGNLNEVREARRALTGDDVTGLTELSVELAVEGIAGLGLADKQDIRAEITRCLRSGSAVAKFDEWIHAQGGRLSEPNMGNRAVAIIESQQTGFLAAIDGRTLGRAAQHLGAGRVSMSDLIDPEAGIELLVKAGDWVDQGQPIAKVITSKEIETWRTEIESAFKLEPNPRDLSAPLMEVVQ